MCQALCWELQILITTLKINIISVLEMKKLRYGEVKTPQPESCRARDASTHLSWKPVLTSVLHCLCNVLLESHV